MKITMFIVIVLIAVCSASLSYGQKPEERFIVKYTFIQSEYNARFVRRFVNYIIPSDKESTRAEIACLSRELVKTNLFRVVDTELERTNESGIRNLRLKIVYKASKPHYVVSKISIDGFDSLDEDVFTKLITERQVLNERLDLRTGFREFEEKVSEIIEKSLKPGVSTKYREPPWIGVSLNSVGELEVLIVPEFRGCG